MSEITQHRIIELNEQVTHLYEQRHFEEALTISISACELSRQHLGESHPSYAVALSNLAMLHRALAHYAESESLLQRSLEIQRYALGELHPDTATTLNSLAGLYHETGKHTLSEPLFKQVLEIYRKTVGENNALFAWMECLETSRLIGQNFRDFLRRVVKKATNAEVANDLDRHL